MKTCADALCPAGFKIAIICFLLITALNTTLAQDTVTGAFQGDVSNNRTGARIAGARVQITNVETGFVYNLTTNSNGVFFQGRLAPGFYDIRIDIDGFKPRLLRLQLKVSKTGDVVPVPVALEPQPAGVAPPTAVLEDSDDIRVEINTTDARRDGSIPEEELTEIPLKANNTTSSFDDLALLLPGVAPPPQTIGDVAGPGVGPGVGSAGQFVANGLRSRANNFTVDGSDNNDEDIGVRRQGFVALIPQPIESIKEFQVITLLAPAQFGRNLGAQVNVVSRAGGKELHGSAYATLNSHLLNSKNFFDTTDGGSSFPLSTASGQQVSLDGAPITVGNPSGSRQDTATFTHVGGTLGGSMKPNSLFYFASGEYQKLNAFQEKSFSVPTIEQRGPFRTGSTGIFRNPFLSANDPAGNIAAVPNNLIGAGLFGLFPFPNNLGGIFGDNTYTESLPASADGLILSGRLDHKRTIKGRPHSFTARLNFTDDERFIPAVNDALFSTVLSKTRTDNLSVFHDFPLTSSGNITNQIRFSVGRSRLRFNDEKVSDFLLPSDQFPDQSFLLNAPLRLNITRPPVPGAPNSGPVQFRSSLTLVGSPTLSTAEALFEGPLGQISLAGFSPLGTDVYNFPQDRKNRTLQLADEIAWRRSDHTYVFGIDYRRVDLDSDLPRLARHFLSFNGVPRLIENGTGGFRFPTSADPNPIIRPEDLVGLGAATNSLLSLNVDRPDARVNLRFHQFNIYAQDTWRVSKSLSLSYGLRYEYNTPVREIDGLIEDTFQDERLDLVPGLDSFIGGRSGLFRPDRNNLAPRVGVAYSRNLLGANRVSVFRAGYGRFFDQILGAVANQSRNVFPSFLTLNFAALSGSTLTALQYLNPIRTFYTTNDGVTAPIVASGTPNTFNGCVSSTADCIPFSEFVQFINANFPSAISSTLPADDLKTPNAHHYSFTFEQQLNKNLTVTLAYVGTTARDLLRFTTPNLGSSLIAAPTQTFPITYLTQGGGTLPVLIPLGVLRSPSRPGSTGRPVPTVGAISIFESTAASEYNSFQAQATGRFKDLLTFDASYTLSRAMDDVSDVFDLAGAYVLPQDSFDLKAEWGPANFDIRHRVAYQLIFRFPKIAEGGFLAALTRNMQIASAGRFNTAQPFTVNSIIDVNLDGNLTDRLDTTQGLEVTGDRSQPLRLTTGNSLSLLAPFGENGEIERNSFRGGSIAEINLSISRDFGLKKGRLFLRADILNLTDRANFGVPIRLLEAPGFGRVINTITPARRINLAIKYEF